MQIRIKGSFVSSLLIVAVLSLSIYSFANAQIPNVSSAVQLSASADNPVPGQTVTITAQSYTTDINAAKTTWTVNGKTFSTGIGIKSIEVKAPDLGKKTTVSIQIVYGDGITASDSLSISSGSVDMIIESAGYVPPFFMGKSSVGYENNVKITAIPHMANSSGVEYDPKNLVYSWKKDDTAIQDGSGYGKQSVIIGDEILPSAYSVSVSISTRDGSAKTQGLISVVPEAPSISFYINDPLYGPLYNVSLGNSVDIGGQDEVGIIAVPFAFNKPFAGLGDLVPSWLINNKDHSELNSGLSINLRAPNASEPGTSNISLSIENEEQVLQTAQAGFEAVFGNSNSSSNNSFNSDTTQASF